MPLVILDILDAIEAFMNRGGPVLTIIMGLLLIKWSLVFERIWYINTTHKKNVKNTETNPTHSPYTTHPAYPGGT